MDSGGKVKEVRQKLEMTQREMAEALGCSITSARRFEYERTTPTVRAVALNFGKLARKAGVSVDDSASTAQ